MMKKIGKVISLLLVLSIISILIIPFTANAANQMTYGQVLDDLSKAQAELDKNNQAINNNKNQKNRDSATIKSLENDIQKMSEETTKLQEEIKKADEEIKDKEEKTKNVVSYLQMSGGENAYLEYVFGTETITDLIYRLAVVEQITEYNENVIKEMQNLIKANEDRKVELKNKEIAHQNKIAQLEEEIKKLDKQISSLGDIGPTLEQEVKSKRDIVNYYKEQGCKNRSDVIGVDCAVTAGNAYFARPIKEGYVTSFVGYRWGSLHRGIDLGSSHGKNTPLYSIGNGVITDIWQDGNGAKCVNIEYKGPNGKYYTAIYGHLSKYTNIYKGMKVTKDTVIGYMGDTGYAFGVHLHLELWPCRLYTDKECRNWTAYVNFAASQFSNGYHGAESVIAFPKRTYTTWYTR